MGKTRTLNDNINGKAMNELSKRKLYEVNEKPAIKRTSSEIGYTEYIADKLVKIYNAPNSRMFFYKCAWNLPEDIIWSAVEDSRKKCVKEPLALFIFICNKALQERPINK